MNHFRFLVKAYVPVRSILNMCSCPLESIPKVDIDPSGVFKYILLKVYGKEKDNQEPFVTIVRGYKRCNYHADIFDEVQEKLQPLDCEPLGGGRISHEPDNKKIHIYGYSQGYGKADHEITAKLVKDAYPQYTITVSDEGSTCQSQTFTQGLLRENKSPLCNRLILSCTCTQARDSKLCIDREIHIEQHDYSDLLLTFDIEGTCKWIADNKFTKISLQFPDELLPASTIIYDELRKRIDADLYILGDTSYASCCIDTVAAMHVKSDAVVHYGHTCFSKTNIPVYIVLPKAELNIDKTIKIITENLQTLKDTKVCLLYGAEFDHCKENLKKLWFQSYPGSYIGYIEKEEHKDRFLGRLLKDATGQIYVVDVLKDCACVYIGSRGQTMFNLAISIAAKSWYLLDPEKMKLEHMEEAHWIKRRRFLVEKCKDADVIGILICKLAGEQTKDIINRMKQLCRINGKKSYIVSVGKPNVAKLANFPERNAEHNPFHSALSDFELMDQPYRQCPHFGSVCHHR
ncbi:hypothetical protein evm_007566 [Chilo suppressalis]|nr:hypothetical protein evm_007566 [Chilo suppressalis]